MEAPQINYKPCKTHAMTNLEKLQCHSRESFPLRMEADAALTDTHHMEVYHCLWCRQYHIGEKSP